MKIIFEMMRKNRREVVSISLAIMLAAILISSLCSLYLSVNMSKSKYYAELSLLYSMLTCNPNDFWPSMYDYVYTHKSNTIPTQYEEAYCLFQDKTGVKFPFELKISPATQERYQSFWDAGNNYARCGMNEDAVREAMREDWGETYWWFNAFGRKNY